MLFSRFLIILACISIFLARDVQAQVNHKEKDKIQEYKLSALQSQYEGDKNTAGHYLNKIAFVYWEKQNLEKAAHYFEQSFRLSVASKNDMSVAMIGSNLASIYYRSKKYNKATEKLERTSKVYLKLGNKQRAAHSYFNLGKVYEKNKQFKLAVSAYTEGLRLANSINDPVLINCYCEGLGECYEKLGMYSKSAIFYKQYARSARAASDYELQSRERAKIEEAELWIRTMEIEKRQQEKELQQTLKKLRNVSDEKGAVELLKSKQDNEIVLLQRDKVIKNLALKEHKLQLEHQRTIIRLGLLGVFLVIGVSIILYISYLNSKKLRMESETQKNEIEVQNTELQKLFKIVEKKNHKITSSINYAKRIQDAILPHSTDFKNVLPQSFILYRPKNIVSGDFYWISERKFNPVFGEKQIKNQAMSVLNGFESERIIVAAVDCTGHGVPGAFMSMIGVNLLNEITIVRNIHKPHKILEELHKGVRKALHQKNTSNRDGMDIAICCYDKRYKTLEYSGARRPLVYIQNKALKIIKGERATIGGGVKPEKQKEFKNHTIQLEHPTTIYLFSDGYQDQFGGVESKKFGQKQMRQLFYQIHEKPFEEQSEILHNTLTDWQGEEETTDDILVLGFKVE